MKPVIQRGLDALEARIRALETGVGSLLATVNALSSLVGFGRLWVNRQVLVGAGTYSPTNGTRRVLVRMIGGGGGGGGAASVSGHPNASGAGGNSGWYIEFRVSGSLTGGPYSCGAGGLGGSSAPGAGGTGGDTTLVINGTTYTARGGTGGGAASDLNGAPFAPATGSTSSGIDFACYCPGMPGITGGTTVEAESLGLQFGGSGGGVPPFGTGGYAVSTGQAFGVPGFGFGSGGSGGAIDFLSVAGASGSAGAIVIDEFV